LFAVYVSIPPETDHGFQKIILQKEYCVLVCFVINSFMILFKWKLATNATATDTNDTFEK